MGIIKARKLMHAFTQKNDAGEVTGQTTVLQGIDLDISAGSFVAIVGHNGSGKTTLARHFNALLQPTAGTVWIDGKDTSDAKQVLSIRQTAGMVFQNPDNQLVASIVEEDVAFGPENLGVPTEEIWERVAASLERTGMSAYREMSPGRLSGGQKQRIAIAGILAMKPACMILDEPTAMLDPGGRQSVLGAVQALSRQEQVTVILITHDMEEAALADRIVVMDHGQIVRDGSPREVLCDHQLLRELRLGIPFSVELAARLREGGMPLPEGILKPEELAQTVSEMILTQSRQASYLEKEAERPSSSLDEEGEDLTTRPDESTDSRATRPDESAVGQVTRPAENADTQTIRADESMDSQAVQPAKNADALISLDHVDYYYSKGYSHEKHALQDISLTIRKGERIALIGPTGSGKSTMLEQIGGLEKPAAGRIFYEGEDIHARGYGRRQICQMTGLVFQYPEYQLFGETILEDVMFGPRNLGLSEEEARRRALLALRSMGIGEDRLAASPFALSGGEKRRVAIAGVLAMQPRILLLDEPAAGLDDAGKKELAGILEGLAEAEGLTILQTSHSMEDTAKFAQRVIVLHEGRILHDGAARDVFFDTDELETIGLAAPQAVYFMRELQRQLLSVSMQQEQESEGGMIGQESESGMYGQESGSDIIGQKAGGKKLRQGDACALRADCLTLPEAAEEILRCWKEAGHVS